MRLQAEEMLRNREISQAAEISRDSEPNDLEFIKKEPGGKIPLHSVGKYRNDLLGFFQNSGCLGRGSVVQPAAGPDCKTTPYQTAGRLQCVVLRDFDS